STLAASPCDSRTALNARSHGWFLISAETWPFTSLDTMMVRPLNAAKPATTSRKSALSHVTVMRAACDCALSFEWAARYASMLDPSPLCAGVATRAACPPWAAAPGLRAGSVLTPDAGPGFGERAATSRLDHASNGVRSEPVLTRT